MSVMMLVWIGGVVVMLGVGLVVVSTLVPVNVESQPAGMGGVVTAVPTGRHAVDLTGEWQPCHRAGRPYNGRHYAGARTWSGNLLEDTTACTSQELAHLLLAA